MFDFGILNTGILSIVAILIALTIHEFAHAYVADYLGDPTPRLMGRVSLNPLVHLDIIGTLFFIFAGFGWAKPVVFDPFNLKNPKRDAGFIALAGPLSNILLAILSSLLIRVLSFLPIQFFVFNFFSSFLAMIIFYNLVLAIFNLIPIYPLDGFKLVESFLPHDKAVEWSELRRFGMIFLILLVFPFFGESLASKIIFPILNIFLRILLPAV